ncbi:MAG: SRPBCC domain-containing protein [Myxococcota bacterium]|nr:SRPBCC domain-containing protein [Myxococcota bacterium]
MTPDVRLERIVPRAKKELFEAWLDPRALSRFMTPAEGMSCGKVEVDPRVGGKFLITMITAGKEMPHHGEYLEISRYERLSFTWISQHAGEGSHVRLRFDDEGAGATRITLEHFGLTPQAKQPHTGGWTMILAELEKLATS